MIRRKIIKEKTGVSVPGRKTLSSFQKKRFPQRARLPQKHYEPELSQSSSAQSASAQHHEMQKTTPSLTAFPSPSPISVAVLRKNRGVSLTRKTISTSSASAKTPGLFSKLASTELKTSNLVSKSPSSRAVLRTEPSDWFGPDWRGAEGVEVRYEGGGSSGR